MTRRLTCGTETGVGGEGARLMILLQFGLEREMSKKIFSSCVSDYPALTCIQIQQKHRQSTQTWDKRSSGSCLCRWGGSCRDIARTWIIIVSIFGPVISIIILKKSYFLPGGAFLIGVASLHELHFTTCWSFLPEMSIIAWGLIVYNIVYIKYWMKPTIQLKLVVPGKPCRRPWGLLQSSRKEEEAHRVQWQNPR